MQLSRYSCVITGFVLTTAAIFAADGSNANFAYNPQPGVPASPVFPHPFASSPGWGGGAKPHQIVDGYRGCNSPNIWDCGLAFTGGNNNWGGQACGIRQATISFGTPRQISAVTVTHHGDEQVPQKYEIQTWNGSQWVTQVNVVNNTLSRCERPQSPAAGGYGPTWTCAITDEFPSVTTSYVRLSYNNCPGANTSAVPGASLKHGWIYEMEAYRLPR
jgi:hypothetical protein